MTKQWANGIKNKIDNNSDNKVMRRNVLRFGLASTISLVPLSRAIASVLDELDSQMVSIEKFSASGKSQGIVRVAKVVKSKQAWSKLLSAEAYQITREAGTEAAYSGAYWNSHADGIYRCICCDSALFDSRHKYESGTGWPSFWQPISALNVQRKDDTSAGMQRDAISCSLCDAHVGHVFGDGPEPTGLRYCMNSAALKFIKRS